MKLVRVESILVVCAASFLACGARAQELQQARVRTAQEYLRLLKIPYSEAKLDREHKSNLIAVLEEWRKHPGEKLDIDGKVPKSLIPSNVDRLLRVSSFKTEWAQTPQYVTGVPEGSPAYTQPSAVRNPNYALWSFGGGINPAELYVSIGDRTGLCDTAGEIWKGTKELKCDSLEYLSASRKRDAISRIGSAMTLNVSTSQVPRFQSGVFLNQQSINRGRDYTFTLQGSFDPVLMFRTPAEWSSWAGHYSKHKDLIFIDTAQNQEPKNKNLRWVRPDECKDMTTFKQGCFERLATGPKFQQIITTILPRVDVKAYTAFDFFKTGLNTFVPTPRSGRALYDITATWDLRKVIPSASARIQALKAAKSFSVPRMPSDSHESGWKAKLESLFLELSEQPSVVVNEKWWTDFRELVNSHI